MLKFIPNEDKYFLEVFLRHLIAYGNGNHVLFGDKPASFMMFNDAKKFDPETFFLHRFSHDLFCPIAKGFKIWKKYEHLFLSKNFAIINTRSFSPEYCSEVFLIHKNRLRKILEENFFEFNKIFPEFISAEHLLECIVSESSIVEQICKYDNLLGIVLGYGKENVDLFEREFQIDAFLFPEQNRTIAHSFKPYIQLRPSSGFENLYDELAHLRSIGRGIIEPEDMLPVKLMLHLPLSFVIDTMKVDIHALRAKLRNQHRQSTQAYTSGKFLEVTLQQLGS